MTLPILYLCHNRPELVKKVLANLVGVEDIDIYVSFNQSISKNKGVDDASHGKILQELNTLQEEGLIKRIQVKNGIQTASESIHEGIDWFFTHVDFGVIIEEDCLLDQRFFKFAHKYLIRFKNNKHVGSISSNLFFRVVSGGQTSGLFSRIPLIWGWGTWRDRWLTHRQTKLLDNSTLEEIVSRFKQSHRFKVEFYKYWSCILDVYNDKLSWDYRLTFSHLSNEWLCLMPPQNFCQNLGYGQDATNTKLGNPHLLNIEGKTYINDYNCTGNIEPYEKYERKLFYYNFKVNIFRRLTRKYTTIRI